MNGNVLWRRNKYNRKYLSKRKNTHIRKHSDYSLSLFKSKVTLSLLETINHSHIKPYSDEEKENIESKIGKLLTFRRKECER